MLPILSSLPPKCFLWHHPFSASAQLYGWMFYCMIVYIWKYLCRFRNEERKQEINLKLNGIYSNYVDLKDILIGKKKQTFKMPWKRHGKWRYCRRSTLHGVDETTQWMKAPATKLTELHTSFHRKCTCTPWHMWTNTYSHVDTCKNQ